MFTFTFHTRLGSVTAQQAGGGGQGEDLGTDAFDEAGMAAAGKVGAADAASEDDISHQGSCAGRRVKKHMAARVAGNMAHFHRLVSDGQHFTVLKIKSGFGAGIAANAKILRAAAILIKRQVVQVNADGDDRAKGSIDALDAGCVVKMAMSAKNIFMLI